jgi:outer membrane protein TolC
MNGPMESHEPTEEFRAHLQWQVESALRRETRFAAPATAGMPWLRAALMVLAGLAAGSIAVMASEQVQDARQRDVLIEAIRSEESLVRVRLDLARADYQDARSRFEVGTAGRETVQAADRQMRAMEMALKRIQLDIQEIQATSAAPRNELHAPLVGGRDFVKDRLTLELDTAQRTLVAAEQAVADARRRIEVGMAPRAVHLQAEAELARARAHMQLVRTTLELRQRALHEKMSAEDLAGALRRMELTLQLEPVQRELEIARERIDEVRRQVSVGMAEQLELKRAEVELLEREVELKRIRRELESLAAVKR